MADRALSSTCATCCNRVESPGSSDYAFIFERAMESYGITSMDTNWSEEFSEFTSKDGQLA